MRDDDVDLSAKRIRLRKKIYIYIYITASQQIIKEGYREMDIDGERERGASQPRRMDCKMK